MPKLKVYISSTFIDKKEARLLILDKIHNSFPEHFEFTEVMEKMRGNGDNREPIDDCLKNVLAADVYILLTGKRYGSAPSHYLSLENKRIENLGMLSFTELEYHRACEAKKLKRYHIYILELTDAFFVSKMEENEKSDLTLVTDLSDNKQLAKYEAFIAKLGQSPIAITDFVSFNNQVNNLLTKSHLQFTTVLDLNISEEHTISIDRRPQIEYLAKKTGVIGHEKRIVSLFVKTKGDDDELDCFTKKLRRLLINLQDKPSLALVDANIVAASSDDEKNMMNILLALTPSIFGEEARFFSFSKFAAKVKDDSIKNQFWAFRIDTGLNDELKHFLKVIRLFIQKINTILEENDFPFNIFFIFYFIDKKGTAPGFVDIFPADPVTERHELDPLANVELGDIEKWLEMIADAKDGAFRQRLISELDDIINQIFIDRASFPKTYKECLKNINSRVK